MAAFVVQVVDTPAVVAMDESDDEDESEDDDEEEEDHDEDEDEEEQEDSSRPYVSVNPPTSSDDRKTKTQRNRERRERERARILQRSKADRAMLQDVFRAKSIAKEVTAALDDIEDRANEKAEQQAAMEPFTTKRLGRKAFVEEPMHVKLQHELPDTLRDLVQEGNLIKDRFLSLQRRNMVETRDRVAYVNSLWFLGCRMCLFLVGETPNSGFFFFFFFFFFFASSQNAVPSADTSSRTTLLAHRRSLIISSRQSSRARPSCETAGDHKKKLKNVVVPFCLFFFSGLFPVLIKKFTTLIQTGLQSQ